MRPVMSVMCLILVAATVACSETTMPESQLVGGWMSPRENLQPRGTFRAYLGFSESGGFTYAGMSYGVYAGESPGTLSAYTNISGTYQIDGDRVVFSANRIATWDAFFGAESRERVEQVNMTIFDQARFRIVGGTLILDYIVYPADAPEPATKAFNRLGPD
jgi:hypothetical protein